MMPLISVIVPVYNTEQYLNHCVDSILNQTFTDFELILVDDGSPDNSGAICDEYAAKDNRIHVIHQENQGVSVARNAGIDWVFANSDSQFISFIDSDDWVHSRFLELLYKGIHEFSVKISQCRFLKTDGSQDVPEVKEKMKLITPAEHYKDYYSAAVWNKLFTRECWDRIRFPVGQIYGEDAAVWYKILLAEKTIALIDEKLYYYFQRADSVMKADWEPKYMARMNTWDAQIAFIRKHGDAELIQAVLNWYCKIGKKEYLAIERSSAISEPEKKKYQAIMRRKFRRILFRNKKEVKNTRYFKWVDATAYSEFRKVKKDVTEKLDELYWTARGILGKPIRIVKRMFKR